MEYDTGRPSLLVIGKNSSTGLYIFNSTQFCTARRLTLTSLIKRDLSEHELDSKKNSIFEQNSSSKSRLKATFSLQSLKYAKQGSSFISLISSTASI